MKFQAGDIVKSNDDGVLFYAKVLTTTKEGVFTTDWDASDIISVKKSHEPYYFYTEEESADFTLVERSGKPYEEEKWIPAPGAFYYHPDPLSECLFVRFVWHDGGKDDLFRLSNGLVFPYTEEGKWQAVERARKMLEVK